MKKKNWLILACILLTAGIVSFALVSCGTSGTPRWTGPVTTIYFGHHWPIEVATDRDPAGMSRIERENQSARLHAEREVLNRLGVRIVWVQYTNENLHEELRSGVPGGQMMDLIRIVGARQAELIEEGLIQPITQFANHFYDEEAAWIFWPKVFGHNFFLNNVLRAGSDTPLVYNIQMLERVPALQQGGRTVLPIHIWQQGNWTWSAFEEYLQHVHDHWTAEWDGRIAWSASFASAALAAMHSNGAHLFNENGIGFASEEAKEAVAFIDRLIARRLLRDEALQPGSSESGLGNQWRFQWGHAVFASLQQWLAPALADSFNERRERVGIVPFPRPDWRSADDPEVRQLIDARDAFAVPSNVSAERAELAIKAFREYTLAYHRRLANSGNALDYLQGQRGAQASAARMILDIGNRNHGSDMLAAWKYLGQETQINEFARNAGLHDFWAHNVLGDSLSRLNNAGPYSTWADVKLPEAQAIIDRIQRAVDARWGND